MHRALSIAACCLALSLPAAALAAPPSAGPPRDAGLELSIGGFLAVPGDDLDDDVDTSVGARGAVGVWLSPNLRVHGAVRYVQVDTGTDLIDVDYFDLALGLTAAAPVGSGGTRGYLSAELIGARVEVEAGPFTQSDEDPGVAGRVGLLAPVGHAVDLDLFLGLTQTFADDDASQDVRWIDLGLAVVFRL